MKKRMTVFVLGIILLFGLSGCTKQLTSHDVDLSGTYEFKENVFSNPLIQPSQISSVHPDMFILLYYIDINEDTIIYSDFFGEVLYENVTYLEKEINEDIDEVFSLDTEGILDTFEKRYDIYSNNKYTGLTIFLVEDQVFIAGIKLLDVDSDTFIVSTINEVTHKDFEASCEKVIYQLILSGVYYTTTYYSCETEDSSYTYSVMEFLSGGEIINETFAIDQKGEERIFRKCPVREETPECDGNWNEEILSSSVSIYIPLSSKILDLKYLNLSWFEYYGDEPDELMSEYNHIVKETYKQDVCEEFFGENDDSCIDADADMYIQVIGNKITRVMYLSFPSHMIEYVEYDEMLEIPEDILDLID